MLKSVYSILLFVSSLAAQTLEIDHTAVTRTFRVQIMDPQGREVGMLTTNVSAPRGDVIWDLPLAADSLKGRYTLKARDIATGVRAEQALLVQ